MKNTLLFELAQENIAKLNGYKNSSDYKKSIENSWYPASNMYSFMEKVSYEYARLIVEKQKETK